MNFDQEQGFHARLGVSSGDVEVDNIVEFTRELCFYKLSHKASLQIYLEGEGAEGEDELVLNIKPIENIIHRAMHLLP